MFSIGEFSKIAKISVKTLRYYDEIGLLIPAEVESRTNYRYYKTNQLMELQKIIVMKQAGLSINDIKAVLKGDDVLVLLKKTRAELAKRQQLLNEDIARLDLLIKNRGKIDMGYQATIKEVPEYTVYYKQGVIKNFDSLGEFVLSAGKEVGEANPGLRCEKSDYNFVSYLDGEFVSHNIKIEYAQAVERAGRDTDTIKFKTLPPVKVISVYHKGPWQGLGEAYAFAAEWAEQNNLETDGLSREVYIDGVWNKDDQADYLTEIQIPIKEK